MLGIPWKDARGNLENGWYDKRAEMPKFGAPNLQPDRTETFQVVLIINDFC